MTADGRLDATYRAASLQRLRDGVDVLVVGGGVTGCGIALDAASRGLSVGLVEQRDFSAGTSSRSSKLVHGGLRYLEQFNFGLVREALRERALLLDRLAPHLVTPLPFLYPIAHRVWERPYVGAGLTLANPIAFTSGGNFKIHRLDATGGVTVTKGDQSASGDVAIYGEHRLVQDRDAVNQCTGLIAEYR